MTLTATPEVTAVTEAVAAVAAVVAPATGKKPKASKIAAARATGTLSNFAVCGALKPSPARMFGVIGNDEVPVKVVRSTVRGTQSHASASDDDKMSANIQSVDVANLPEGCDTLRVRFQLVINRLDGYGMSVCVLPAVHDKLTELHKAYGAKGGYDFLAGMYVENLAKGNFLWRNRYGATAPKVTVKLGETVYNLAVAADKAAVVKAFGAALAGETSFDANGVALPFQPSVFIAQITAEVQLGIESQVYPSEELVTNKGSGQGRILAKDDKGNALMHSQKIGNALRRIDIWHGKMDAFGALPVEPYGTAANMLDAARLKTNSFYDYLNNVVKAMDKSKVAEAIFKSKSAADISEMLPDAHYFMSMLIRGGVFSSKADEVVAAE